MEVVNTNYCESSFDPTPKLKSSPVPILFVSFNEDKNCIYCEKEYGSPEGNTLGAVLLIISNN